MGATSGAGPPGEPPSGCTCCLWREDHIAGSTLTVRFDGLATVEQITLEWIQKWGLPFPQPIVTWAQSLTDTPGV
ncbi:hypothetical protein M514_18991 [Trichuris suis]|uniref:Uncharacterized protein n=1 Tax=Trichuris suis TaxID=68888 RepID=A0A085NH04_9BILA|nr:hypothetical protein M514_18991 [Trichuris suis]